jgi:hypothetical protein
MDSFINLCIVKKFQLKVDDKLELIAYIEFMQTLIVTGRAHLNLTHKLLTKTEFLHVPKNKVFRHLPVIKCPALLQRITYCARTWDLGIELSLIRTSTLLRAPDQQTSMLDSFPSRNPVTTDQPQRRDILFFGSPLKVMCQKCFKNLTGFLYETNKLTLFQG